MEPVRDGRDEGITQDVAHRRRVLLLAPLLALVLTALAGPHLMQSPRSPREQARWEVVEAVLELPPYRQGSVLYTEMRHELLRYLTLDGGTARLPEIAGGDNIPAPLVERLLRASDETLPGGLTRPLEVLTIKQAQKLFPGDFAEDFHARYGERSQSLTLSPIVFSDEGSEALLGINCYIGSLASHAGLIYLNRVNGRWRVVSNPVYSCS
jgi:hypothetical protein